jgi:hypothetical protein
VIPDLPIKMLLIIIRVSVEAKNYVMLNRIRGSCQRFRYEVDLLINLKEVGLQILMEGFILVKMACILKTSWQVEGMVHLLLLSLIQDWRDRPIRLANLPIMRVHLQRMVNP